MKFLKWCLILSSTMAFANAALAQVTLCLHCGSGVRLWVSPKIAPPSFPVIPNNTPQVVEIKIGEDFQLNTNTPVTWVVQFQGKTITGSALQPVDFIGGRLWETTPTETTWAVTTRAVATTDTPVMEQFTVIATSIVDPTQIITMHVNVRP